jgi:hypothetical protein
VLVTIAEHGRIKAIDIALQLSLTERTVRRIIANLEAEPVAPTPPVVVETTPAPVINIPAAQQITPTWIYAIIGIGAALAVVVIVLIVRTRRP